MLAVVGGVTLTALGLYLLRFIHDDMIGMIAILLLLPYAFVGKWSGHNELLTWVAQALYYLVLGYAYAWATRSRIAKRKPS